jgi:hypothetical protein
MQGVDIADRLKEVLPKYTNKFSDITSISSLTRSGTTITAVTASSHGLATNDQITIKGALDPITITSLTRVDNVVTVITATPHNFSKPSLYSPEQADLLTVTIDSADPSDYNGTFKLLSVANENTLTYQISTTPTSPATTAGFLLQEDYDGYNGYKTVTVIDTTTFTYETTNTNLNTPAQGTIEMSDATRIGWAATAERAVQFYTSDNNRQNENWMFVVVGTKQTYKDDTTTTDPSSAKNTNQSYFYDTIQEFSIYIFIPSEDEVLGGAASDLARQIEQPILKSIANYEFSSFLCEQNYQQSTYVGSEADEYNTVTYVHRFDFLAKGFIQNADTIDFNPGVPLKAIDGSILDKDMTYKITSLRQ